MSNVTSLSAFLKKNAAPTEGIKFAPSARFTDSETQKPAEWEIRAVSSEQDEKLRTSSMRNVPIPGKKGAYIPQLDTSSYLAKLAAACTAFPPLNDASLQDDYGVMGDTALLKALLSLPGEYSNYIAKVQEVCGFDTDFSDMVDDAKN